MIEIFGYKFAEKWAELSPRFAECDQVPELSLEPFPKYAKRQSGNIMPQGQLRNTDPLEVQNLMVSAPVLMAYANDLMARIGGLINDRMVQRAKARAVACAGLQAKSEAERNRKLDMEPSVQQLVWEIQDLETMHSYLKGLSRALGDMSNNWRAVYYGTQNERKQTPSIEAPTIGGPRDP